MVLSWCRDCVQQTSARDLYREANIKRTVRRKEEEEKEKKKKKKKKKEEENKENRNQRKHSVKILLEDKYRILKDVKIH